MTTTRVAPQAIVLVKRPGQADFQPLQVLSLTYEDEESKTDKVSFRVDNYNLDALDGDACLAGNRVRFTFGYPGNMAPPRDGIIVCVKGWQPLTVEADDLGELLNRVPRTSRIWEQVKRSDVVREILEAYGYRDDRLHIEDTKVVVPSVTQGGCTDLQVIRRLASEEGFEFYFAHDGAHFHSRNLKQRPVRVLTYHVDPSQGDIISISIDENKRLRKAGAVKVEARDPITGETKEIRSDNTTTAGDRTKLSEETGTFGTEVFEAVDKRSGETLDVERPPSPDALQGGLAQEVVAGTAASPEIAQRAADGLYRKNQLKGIKLTVTVVLDPMLTATSVVELRGVGVRLGGLWYIKSAKHDTTTGHTVLKLAREGAGTANAAKKNEQEGETTADGEPIVTMDDGSKWIMREVVDSVSGVGKLAWVQIAAGAVP